MRDEFQRKFTRDRKPAHTVFQMALLAVGAAAVVALLHDLGAAAGKRSLFVPDMTTDIQCVRANLSEPKLVDPKGYFRIAAPSHWMQTKWPDSSPYHIILHSLQGPNICLMATPVAYNSLPELFKEIEASEKEAGIATDVETTRFQGRPAIRRTAKLSRERLLAFDFVESNVAYHIMCAAPKEVYDQYESVVIDVLNTFEPIKPDAL